MPAKVSSLATGDQVAQAMAALSDEDLVRLKRIAQMRAHGLVSFDWQDLLQESIARALAGSRQWPLEVPFIAFLAQTVRSIANEEWERPGRQQVTTESDFRSRDADGEHSADLSQLASDPVDPEREAAARDSLRHIESLFREDPDALAILHGLAQGLSPDEVQTGACMTSTRYESAQKRIRRKLARSFG